MGFRAMYWMRIRANSAKAPEVAEVIASIPLGVCSITCMGYPFRFSGCRFQCLCFCVESKVVAVLVHSVGSFYWISLPAGIMRAVWTSIVASRVGLKLIRVRSVLAGVNFCHSVYGFFFTHCGYCWSYYLLRKFPSHDIWFVCCC